jgi:hypothetical protein
MPSFLMLDLGQDGIIQGERKQYFEGKQLHTCV